MKFVDEVRITVSSGAGGGGAVAFRREKYMPKGGPSGGDGGAGGSVIFRADPMLTTLLDYRYRASHAARSGQHGMGSDCNGRAAEDLVLRVPVGTIIRDQATGDRIVDLDEADAEWIACKGGRGGLGNMNFATSVRQSPRFAQPGEEGELKALLLELRLLADVGLVGFPNAGKSTLVSVVSRARPKIADYPFTTLVPNLGMVGYKDHLSFVIADLPGLIEGASEGKGLGHQFLRHAERCRVLVHVLDAGAPDLDPERELADDFKTIERELARYSSELARRPRILAINKIDLPAARVRAEAYAAKVRKSRAKGKPLDVVLVSGATKEGLDALLDACAQVLWKKA